MSYANRQSRKTNNYMTTTNTLSPSTFADLSEQAVFIFSPDAALTENLALDLRHHGLRVRTFINQDVLRNAVQNEAPLAVVTDIAESSTPLTINAQYPVPLLFFGPAEFEQRLRAVRAHGSDYFPHPLNRSALLHRLMTLASSAPHPAGRVLLIDGPGQDLQEAAQALQVAGLQPHYSTAPEQALEVLEQQPFDLLLLNDSLAQMRGSELLQVVRQNWRLHALPAILLTQASKRHLDAEATAAGADAVLGLPVAATDLVAVAQAKIARARQLLETYSYSIRRDPNTGLFNRDYFLAALRQAVIEASAGPGGAALLWLELEPQQHERPVSRAVFAEAANLLQHCLPPLALAAQLTPAAVAILLPALNSNELESLLERVRAAAQQLPDVDWQLGVTLLSSRQRSAADALDLARQAALQNANPTVTEDPAASAWSSVIQDALRDSRFRLVYQPIASLSGQPSSYYEVFIRMLAEDGRDILPQEFLPTVEKAGLAEALDRWVLARAVDVMESQRHLHDQPTLFVKLFPDSVASGASLIAWLADRIHSAALDPARLVLQVQQQCANIHPAQTQQFVDAARQLGCQIALERFQATGETGQRLLQSLRPDFVRLDGLLTQDIGSNLKHQRRVEMIAGQCRAINAKPIAALVQDALHLSVLWRCGVEYIQGYFMQEPADVFAADETLSQH